MQYPFTRAELPAPPPGYDRERFAVYDTVRDECHLGYWAQLKNGPPRPARGGARPRFVLLDPDSGAQ